MYHELEWNFYQRSDAHLFASMNCDDFASFDSYEIWVINRSKSKTDFKYATKAIVSFLANICFQSLEFYEIKNSQKKKKIR